MGRQHRWVSVVGTRASVGRTSVYGECAVAATTRQRRRLAAATPAAASESPDRAQVMCSKTGSGVQRHGSMRQVSVAGRSVPLNMSPKRYACQLLYRLKSCGGEGSRARMRAAAKQAMVSVRPLLVMDWQPPAPNWAVCTDALAAAVPASAAYLSVPDCRVALRQTGP